MSFLTDLFEGNFGNLGTDITHAPESLGKHPKELYETLGGAAALATGGLALGALAPEAGAIGLEGAVDAAALPETAALDAGTSGFVGNTEIGSLFAQTGAAPAQGADVGGLFGSMFGNTTGAGGLDAGGVAGGSALPAASAPTAGIVPSAGGAPAGGGGGIWDSITGGLKGLGLTPAQGAGALVGAGALGYDFLKGQQPLADQAALQGQANQMSAQGQKFMSYLQKGTLPPGLQTLVDKQTNAARAMAISNAAKNGQSTDPTQNTQLADAINNARQQATAQVALIGEDLFKQGLSETQVTTQILEYLTKLDEQQTQNMGMAIMNFASALSGGPLRKA